MKSHSLKNVFLLIGCFIQISILFNTLSCSMVKNVTSYDERGRVSSIETRTVNDYILLYGEEFLYEETTDQLKEHFWYRWVQEEKIVYKKEKFTYYSLTDQILIWRLYVLNADDQLLELSSMWEYQYNENGMRTSASFYDGPFKEYIKGMVITYDDHNQLASKTRIDVGEPSVQTTYEYNEKGLLIKKVVHNLIRDISSSTVYDYDSDGRLILEQTGERKYRYKYDDQGNQLFFFHFLGNQQYERATRRYDPNGNLEQLSHTKWNENREITDQWITYFKEGIPYLLEVIQTESIRNANNQMETTKHEFSIDNPTEIAIKLTLEPQNYYGPDAVIPTVENPLYTEKWYPFLED